MISRPSARWSEVFRAAGAVIAPARDERMPSSYHRAPPIAHTMADASTAQGAWAMTTNEPAEFVPTHVAPMSGLRAWSQPDVNLPESGTLSGGLPVQVA